ncbi:DUF6308 family protein [Aeromicrobium duanguangcaii]|uniref:DUF6308 family protein n=1 Tax=Aeromicrobium duanguangcaii TaxID=2968086 RepID=UPI002017DE77|nr:DUF6308 family protein [Aeromicrobium duanguangcaii]
MNATDPVAHVRESIRDIVSDRGADLVSAYYDEDNGFAGDMFDTFGANPYDRFTSDDLIAASLLDVRFGPTAIRDLLVNGQANHLLEKVPSTPESTLWNTELQPESAAWKLWEHLTNIEGIGRTRASKLMARKRPHLMPILDSVIVDKLGLGRRAQWKTLAAALDDETRIAIDRLQEAVAGSTPSTLRLLDVATWMRHSQSRRAKAVRARLGFPVGVSRLSL